MRPMLAAATNGKNLVYPLIASPKLDGIRCLIIDGVVVSRSLKPIPNAYVQRLFGKSEYNGLDGELIVGRVNAPDVFQVTTSGVMSHDGEPNVTLHIFDDFTDPKLPFINRVTLSGMRAKQFGLTKSKLVPVQHLHVHSKDELDLLETKTLASGFEGVMLRRPDGQYKFGRSTLKSQDLLKLKRFNDAEAEILECYPLMRNDNVIQLNELGYKERSTKKAGKVALPKLGGFHVRDVKTGVEFDIGTGFTETQRVGFWKIKNSLKGKLAKYKCQPVGVKDKPRFPVFLGFRSKDDL